MALHLKVAALETALRQCMKWMKELADSGDAGFFEAKDIPAYVEAERVLAQSGTPQEKA